MLEQLAAIWEILVLGLLLLLYFGFVGRSWSHQSKPRPAYRSWHIASAVAALVVLIGWLAFDLFSPSSRPDQGVATYLLIPVQVFLAVGVFARVRWNLYPVAILAGIAAIFTGEPAILSPSAEPMEFVRAATCLADLGVLVAAIQTLVQGRRGAAMGAKPGVA